MFKKLVVAVGLTAFMFSAAPAFAQNVFAKCHKAKTKCICKKVCDRFKAITKDEGKPDPAKLAAANAKLEAKFTACLQKADAKGGCAPGASIPTLEAKVDAFVASVFAEIGSPSGAFLE